MKLIIDIPDNEYKYTCELTLHDRSIWDYAIRKGTPLDDVKTEINRKANSGQWSDATVYGMKKALAIIDKHIADMRGE